MTKKLSRALSNEPPTHEELMAWISGEGLVHSDLVNSPDEPPEDEEEDE